MADSDTQTAPEVRLDVYGGGTPQTQQQTDPAFDLGAAIRAMGASRQKVLDANEALAKKQEANAAAMQPAVADVQQAQAQAGQQRNAAVASLPQTQLPAAPPQKLHEFLAPREGESPETSIRGMMQGLGLIAMGLGGKRSAKAALAAFSGAMKGWQEGDREAADRHFKEWQANVDKTLAEADENRKNIKTVMEAAELSIEDKMRTLQLLKLEKEMQTAPDLTRLEGLQAMAKYDSDQAKLIADLQKHKETLEAQKALKEEQLRFQHEWKTMMFDAKMKEIELRTALGERGLDLRGQQVAINRERVNLQTQVQMDPGSLEAMARNSITRGVQPNLARLPTADRVAYWKKYAELAPEYGGQQGIVARDTARRALTNEASQLAAVRGKTEAFAGTARRNLDQLVELSNKIDRATGRPMIDRWIMAGRKAWSGDPDVADFDVAMRTVVGEVTRVLDSATATGVITDTSRRETQDLISTAMNKEQIIRAVQRYKMDMDNREASYNAQFEYVKQQAEHNAAPAGAAAPPESPNVKYEREKAPTPPAKIIEYVKDPKTGRYVPKP